MPTYDLDATTNINATGNTPGFDVKDGESLELAAGGIIKAEGTGINYTGSAFLTIKGTVDAGGYAVNFGVVNPSPNLTLHVGHSGVLKGNSGIGSFIGANSSLTLINDGWIEAKAGPVLNIANVASVANNGTIAGSIRASNVEGTGMIINSGSIVGDVDWSNGGRVIVDNRHGTISGDIKLSREYRSTFYGGSGSEDITLGSSDDYADGGAGNDIFRSNGRGIDTILGGSGNDTVIFQGASTDYTINRLDAHNVKVIRNANASADIAGLKDIRFLKFNDKTEILYNTAPDSIGLSTKVLAETAQVNTPVISLSARDADGDALTYSLVDPSGTFRLDGNTLVLTKALDYESGARQVTVTVEAKDNYGGKASQAFTIDIANVVEENPLTLFGTAGADVLAGENGSDKFYGGLGNDTLTGGLGQDVFVFDARLAKTNTANKRYNLDRITDFNVADDTIHLKKSIFKGISKTGVLSKSAFYAGTKSAAHDASDRIIYNKNTGALLYDQDGDGHRYQAIQIATLSTKLALKNTDFFVI